MRNVVCAALILAVVVTGCNRPERALEAHRPQVRAEAAGAGSHEMHMLAGNAAAPAQTGTNSSRLFGAALTPDAPTVRLAQVLAAPQQYGDRPLRVEGTVVAVCQAMGCWMEVRDDATQAHIRMHGHSFFVPRDVNGRRAAVQATLVAAHPATECDREAQGATGRVAQLELDATGVEVYN